MKREYGYQRIFQWLYDNHHTMKWLSAQTNIPYSTLKRKMYKHTEWRTGEIDRLLSVTGMTYEEIFREDITA